MKAKISYSIFSLLLVVLFCSCLNNNDYRNEAHPHNPHFGELRLHSVVKDANLQMTRFSLEYDETEKDSIITNNDSLPFQTRIDSVAPIFYFYSSSKAVLTIGGQEFPIVNREITKSGKENLYLDFTKPATVYNVSSNKKNTRTYKIKVNIHQVDPDLYQWNELNKEVNASATKSQKALLFNKQFLYFSVDANGVLSLSKSSEGKTWTSENISNVSNPELRTLTEFKGELFLATQGGKFYRSVDASVWTEVTVPDFTIKNLLFSFKDNIWAIASQNNEFYFVYSTDGVSWQKTSTLPENFPLLDYSALVFSSPVGNPKVILLGGRRELGGELLKARWSTKNPFGEWSLLSSEYEKRDSLSTAENAAIVQYDNRLVLFGGNNKEGKTLGILESYNEGLTWQTPKKDQMQLPENWSERSQSSAFLSEDEKRIYVVGGASDSKVFSDFLSVQLNKISFKNYKPKKRKLQ